MPVNNLTKSLFFRIKTNGSLPRDKRMPSPSLSTLSTATNGSGANAVSAPPVSPFEAAEVFRFDANSAPGTTEGTDLHAQYRVVHKNVG